MSAGAHNMPSPFLAAAFLARRAYGRGAPSEPRSGSSLSAGNVRSLGRTRPVILMGREAMRRLLLAVPLLALPLLVVGPRPAESACCYFAAKDKDVSQPAQKAFLTWDAAEKVETFTVQPKFEGNAADFGMVIPTPAKPKLDEMPRDFFKE